MMIYQEKPSVFRNPLFYAAILVLMIASFYGGIVMAKKSEIDEKLVDNNTVFLGSVVNKYEAAASKDVAKDVDFNLFWQVWNTVKDKYVDGNELQEKKLFYGALAGIVGATEDPYSVFMNPVTSKEFNNDLKGTFDGIGAEIGMKEGLLTIIAPLADMPAEKAGLKAGDKIIKINNEDTAGMSVDMAVSKIRGERGTQVTLNIWRESFSEPKDFIITRDKIIVKSVKWEVRDDGIGVIKISNFNVDTSDLFNKAIREVTAKKPKGLILDLRNNPGGFLETAIDVASEWVNGEIVVIQQFGDGRKEEYLGRGSARLSNIPTVVLVNQGSASASEIVSGALKDHGKATIIGKTTFGKGSVQDLIPMPDGSSVKITIAKWLTPKGTDINKHGIEPNETVELTEEDYSKDRDPQMEAAVKKLKGEK